MSKTSVFVQVVLAALVVSSYTNVAGSESLYSHGSCAATAVSPFGAALVIDSRITLYNASRKILGHSEGCKLRNPRPAILLAATGMSAVDGVSGHWESLDAATEFLKDLPDNPTEQQIYAWGDQWADALILHFKIAGKSPPQPGALAELILMTKVNDVPVFSRSTVWWDGNEYTKYREQVGGISGIQYNYSGFCREFTDHRDYETKTLLPARHRSRKEAAAIAEVGEETREAGNLQGLIDGLTRLEKIFTDIDVRVEGDDAEIGPPYSVAWWKKGDPGWTVEYNPACERSSERVPPVTSTPPQQNRQR